MQQKNNIRLSFKLQLSGQKSNIVQDSSKTGA